MHTGKLTTGHGQVAPLSGTDRHDHSVVAAPEVRAGHVGADVDPGTELHTLGLHLLDTTIEVLLLHLEFRDAIAQESTHTVGPLEHSDRVSGARKLLCSGQASRARTDDRDGPT